MTKAPTTTEKSKTQRDNIKKNRHQKLQLHNDYGPTEDGKLNEISSFLSCKANLICKMQFVTLTLEKQKTTTLI